MNKKHAGSPGSLTDRLQQSVSDKEKGSHMLQIPHERYQQAADYIMEHSPERPAIALVLGTALGSLAEEIEDPLVIPFHDIPGFLVSTAPNQKGELILGRLNGRFIACYSGRFHYYEGYSQQELTIPVRVASLIGVKTLILTNAAGAINTTYKPGELMLITDTLNLTGLSPLRGPNDGVFGPRFFNITPTLSPSLQELAREAASEQGITLHQGVYAFMTGPQYETHAEIRALGRLGADAVGMSTVSEIITAAHCDMNVLAFSMLSNMAAGVVPYPISEDEIVFTGARAAVHLAAILKAVVPQIGG